MGKGLEIKASDQQAKQRLVQAAGLPQRLPFHSFWHPSHPPCHSGTELDLLILEGGTGWRDPLGLSHFSLMFSSQPGLQEAKEEGTWLVLSVSSTLLNSLMPL